MTNSRSHAILPPHPIPRIVSTLRCPTGNFHQGRGGNAIKYFIRHNTESSGIGNAPSLSWFLSEQSGVSIHHLIARNGTRFDLVYRADIAFHAGSSAWGDDDGSLVVDSRRIGTLNVLSLGMEFESSSTEARPGNGYTDEQLWGGAYTEACSLVSYEDLVVLDHRQIAIPAGRRHDPSHFPLEIYSQYVGEWCDFLLALPDNERGKWCL